MTTPSTESPNAVSIHVASLEELGFPSVDVVIDSSLRFGEVVIPATSVGPSGRFDRHGRATLRLPTTASFADFAYLIFVFFGLTGLVVVSTPEARQHLVEVWLVLARSVIAEDRFSLTLHGVAEVLAATQESTP